MKLKPCPLCGGIAEIGEITQDAEDSGISRYYVVGVKIECRKCGLLWIAQVPNTCIIEVEPACRVYDGLRDSREEIAEEVRLLRRTIREFKKTLKEARG